MSTIASSRIKTNQQLKQQSFHTICNMIDALFNQNYQKYTFFCQKYIILNSYIFHLVDFESWGPN